MIDAARRAGATLVVVDTAPREAGGAAEAARLADLVLVPCRPTSIDLAAIPATASAIGTEATVLLNACPARGQWTAQASAAVRSARRLGLELAPVTIGARLAHPRAFTAGQTATETEPRSIAAAEIAALYSWLQEVLA